MFIYLARLACHLSITFFFVPPFLWAPLRANNNGQCKRVIVIVQKMENKNHQWTEYIVAGLSQFLLLIPPNEYLHVCDLMA